MLFKILMKFRENFQKILEKFFRTEKYSVILGHILKKRKCKKNLGNI